MEEPNKLVGENDGLPLTLGELIARKRKEANWSQNEFAVMLGISSGAVSNWERGGAIAEDNWPMVAKLLQIDTTVLSDEMLSQIGRKSRRPSKVLDPIRTVFQRKLEIGEARNVREDIAKGSPDGATGRIFSADIKLNAQRLPRNLELRISSSRKAVYEELAHYLPIDLHDNIGVHVSCGGHTYLVDYYSEKLVMMIDTVAFHNEKAGEYQGTLPFSAARLWNLAFLKKVSIGDNRAYHFALRATEGLLNSQMLQRRLIECGAMGLRLTLAFSISALADAILAGEKRATEHFESDEYDEGLAEG